MKELRTSNELLGRPGASHEVLDAEGYVFFRNVIDHELVEYVKRGVMAWFRANGYIEVVDNEPVWTGVDLAPLGEYPPGLYATCLWEWFARRPEIHRLYRGVFGEPARVLPMGEYQFLWPGRPDVWTRVHQDGPYNPLVDFVVMWVPLMSIDEDLGGLALVPTPQSCGSLHPPVPEGWASSLIPFIPSEAVDDDAWHRIDYEPGDVLFFAPYTPHCGMPNSSDRVRLSIDIRVQPASSAAPISGVVTDVPSGRVVIADDSGEVFDLELDRSTAMPLMDAGDLLGRRVLATARAGHATLIRNHRGYVPWYGE
jgi:hypothetical protein